VSGDGLTIAKVEWRPAAAERYAAQIARDAPAKAAEVLRAHAAAKVPYLTGSLASSAVIHTEDEGTVLGYTAPYAGVLHAHADDWAFNGGRSGHWLEEAIDEARDDLRAAYTDTARADWPGP
jgi:hypothetical protein